MDIAALGFAAPVVVLLAIYAGFASTINFSRKLKIAGFAIAILAIVVSMTHGLNNDILKNVILFFLVLFFLPYTFATWIANLKNRFSRKK